MTVLFRTQSRADLWSILSCHNTLAQTSMRGQRPSALVDTRAAQINFKLNSRDTEKTQPMWYSDFSQAKGYC